MLGDLTNNILDSLQILVENNIISLINNKIMKDNLISLDIPIKLFEINTLKLNVNKCDKANINNKIESFIK